jgi:hypothetical protein
MTDLLLLGKPVLRSSGTTGVMVMRMSLEDHLGTSTAEKSRRAHRITPSEPIWENKDFFCEILVFARRPGPCGIFCTRRGKKKKNPYGISEHRLV